VRTINIQHATIDLQDGEHYAGLILNADGTPSHHLVLLPEAAERMAWQAAVEHAKDQGGTLPTRAEQALLFANLKSQFKAAWYWSSEEYEGDGSYAWNQFFLDGYQYYDRESYEARCRAVRLIQLTA
jgi:hypothetical protein